MGDSLFRDNFAHMASGYRQHEFELFLDYVERDNGELIIVGDLFELWQANMSRVLTHRKSLLDRLAAMGTRYIIGNHDIDLMYFGQDGRMTLDHPLFDHILSDFTLYMGGLSIHMIHGHEQDPYCCDEHPGIGRISAIYTGMKEDRNGGPLQGKYTVEGRTLGRLTFPGRVRRWLRGDPSPTQVIRKNIVKELSMYSGADALIFGHTHEPGLFVRYPDDHGMRQLPIYNCGSWTEHTPSFVRIEPNGYIGVYDWVDSRPVPNGTELVVN